MNTKRVITVLTILSLMALLVFGCARESSQYPAGYAPYGQQPNQQGGSPIVGQGCAVKGPDIVQEPYKVDVQIAV